MPQNLYITIPALRTRLGLADSTQDATLAEKIEVASRYIDSLTGRWFFTRTATEYLLTGATDKLLLPYDLLSITSLKTDSELDNTFDGETWAADTDYWLWPSGKWPKLQVRLARNGNYSFPLNTDRYVAIAGTWGHGDGDRQSPWDMTGVTGTVATTNGTTLTISVSAGIDAGSTILMGTEQMYVSAVTTTSATVTRAVNGTTAAIQASAAISIAAYPVSIREACRVFAIRYFVNRRDTQDLKSAGLGDYRWERWSSPEQRKTDGYLVERYMRSVGA